MDQRVFEALASQVRRQMLVELAAGELNAGDIAARFEISKPAISQHLTVLESAGLVVRRKKGQYVFYSLVGETLSGVLQGLLDQTRTREAAPAPALQAVAAESIPERETLRRNLPPQEPAAPPIPAKPSVPAGYRWEAWRARGGP